MPGTVDMRHSALWGLSAVPAGMSAHRPSGFSSPARTPPVFRREDRMLPYLARRIANYAILLFIATSMAYLMASAT